MIDRTTALNTLKLAPDATNTDIVKAYSRLARRYPLQQFPERHAQLLEAKTALLNPALGFRNILSENHLDISWLTPYTRQKTQADPDTQTADQQTSLQNALASITRPHLKKGLELFHMGHPMANQLDSLFNEIDPDDIRKLMRYFEDQ